jgi:hypothetical protein
MGGELTTQCKVQEALLFLKKKKQKNFAPGGSVADKAYSPGYRSFFWFFFSKKSGLPAP